ncbi:related to SSF1-nucleolar protein involved in the assembly of the large ribosomal subunit [Serendipita indica DSM 11827]|uniref:Related to SSF1-nucleolar protein involved in the assembly of the large ribosomal subunit n=1 Tax=Serendipita indica (strain DSM 11827) TaxID=1109443 RepID=G4T788_SERID|nr:related to SSF1-nucleolar protein involved in the assembly of the large ribosomal subunit [Serendipita indica DSM 11827]
MARRRKHRTHNKGNVPPKTSNGNPGDPKSFVIKHGSVGYSITQLVRDMRKVMEPNTATRLRERTRNKLKDYLVLGPTLEVTHIMAFSLTEKAPTFRIIRLPSGPSLNFRIERYSLMKDVLNSKKRKRSKGLEYLTAPLLVLAAFPPASPTTPPHLALLLKAFQSMFPSLSPQTISLSSARRVVLVHYNADRDTVDFRHYLITIRAHGVSRRVRKLLEGTKLRGNSVLDLGNEKDVADYILKQAGADGYESASSYASDAEEGDANKIELPSNYVGRNNRKGEQRSVSLEEVGPRMELSLLKITEGLPGKEGAVIWHRFIKKSAAEVRRQKAEHAEKAKLREQRRKEQEENIARKAAQNGQKPPPEDAEEEKSEEEASEDDNWDDEEEIESEGEGEESVSESEEDD